MIDYQARRLETPQPPYFVEGGDFRESVKLTTNDKAPRRKAQGAFVSVLKGDRAERSGKHEGNRPRGGSSGASLT
ncbi:hypothetical protein [Scytonema sp. HK-05]|uniref:hypothetical protein n=1 Tax=Scytonema sp. HK-05 TaxID=1137095 RepID=UPI000B274F5D|nr:hypothetical protein [Scytonema sp. HK-05]